MSASVDDISKIVEKTVKEANDLLRAEFEKSMSVLRTELEALKAENSELKMRIINTERSVEKNEQ